MWYPGKRSGKQEILRPEGDTPEQQRTRLKILDWVEKKNVIGWEHAEAREIAEPGTGMVLTVYNILYDEWHKKGVNPIMLMQIAGALVDKHKREAQ